MRRDLPLKLTQKLQETLLPMLHSYHDYRSIAEQCTRLDQGLRRIATQAAKNRPSYMARKALPEATKVSQVPAESTVLVKPGILPASRQLTAPPTLPVPLPPPSGTSSGKPAYANPQERFESNSCLCYNCGKPGRLKADCPEPKKPSQMFEINKESRFEEVSEEELADSGKEEP